jgi:hypothetical protein
MKRRIRRSSSAPSKWAVPLLITRDRHMLDSAGRDWSFPPGLMLGWSSDGLYGYLNAFPHSIPPIESPLIINAFSGSVR